MNLWKAPVDALYSKQFYKQAAREKLSKGFAYLAYLGAIFTLLSIIVLLFRGMPQIDAFVEWLKQDMPRLNWTPDGLIMNEQSPYEMVHPKYSDFVITFDTTVDGITPQQMGSSSIFFTATRAYVRQDTGEPRAYDLTRDPSTVDQNNLAVELTPDLVAKTYASIKPLGFIVFPIGFFCIFIMGKVIGALIYSLAGLVINLSRKDKLNYAQILNLSIFAMTGSIIIQFRGFLHPALIAVPFGLAGGVLMTTAYLVYAIKFTEDSLGSENPSL